MYLIGIHRGGRWPRISFGKAAILVRVIQAYLVLVHVNEVIRIFGVVVLVGVVVRTCLTLVAVEGMEVLYLIQLLLRSERNIHLIVDKHLLRALILEVKSDACNFALRIRVHLIMLHVLEIGVGLALAQIVLSVGGQPAVLFSLRLDEARLAAGQM